MGHVRIGQKHLGCESDRNAFDFSVSNRIFQFSNQRIAFGRSLSFENGLDARGFRSSSKFLGKTRNFKRSVLTIVAVDVFIHAIKSFDAPVIGPFVTF